ncbi:heterokaryon incompatibility protein-domain-containing protein [Cladorrhinum sp. PSN259]|nr:heterokaryon incompatibility protein-domain-containing protein [Cladorrhinum sp. PSN259]
MSSLPALRHFSSREHRRIYRPLKSPDSIRLVILEQGHGTEPICCRLEDAQLSAAPAYEALSYTWGDERIKLPITCSGLSMLVTTNLHSALQHLRHEDQPRVLWVDALCINQADSAEKSIQVPLMGAIYSGADEVLIWLGEETADVRGALQLIPQMRRHYNKMLRFRRVVFPLLSQMLGPLAAVLMHWVSPKRTHAPVDWAPVINLFRRPWFTRTWIIQEAVLARRATMHCGHMSVSWEAIADVAWGMYTVGGMPRLGGRELTHMIEAIDVIIQERNNRYRSRGVRHALWPPSMVDLLIRTRLYDCGNKRDRIYGLLGIAVDKLPQEKKLKPDYALGVDEVYRDFVVWNVVTNGSLESFSCCTSSEKAASQPPTTRPSWVPDFANLEESPTMLPMTKRGNLAAAGDTQVRARFQADTNTLGIWGLSVDKVHRVGKLKCLPRSYGLSSQLALAQLTAWVAECLNLAREASSGIASSGFDTSILGGPSVLGLSSERYEMFWRTMLFGHDHTFQPVSAKYGPMVQKFIEKLLQGPGTRGVPFTKMDQLVLNTTIARAQGRLLMETVGGRLGWVTVEAAPGDAIFVLYGGKVLYVLRELDSGHHQLVGDCFVHGLMGGEALYGNQTAGEPREFNLV